MFGLRLTTKRELSLFNAVIQDQKARILALERAVQSEKKRAEAAINALLIKRTGLALTPDIPINEDQEEQLKVDALDIFRDLEEEKTAEETLMERLQIGTKK